MRFMMLMIPKAYQRAAADAPPTPEMISAMMRYNEALAKAGVLLGLDGLQPPSQGVRLHFSAGAGPKILDGPFAEAKEAIGGYWIIQVRSKEEAVEWASRCPAWDGDVLELRQIQEMSDFPPESVPEVSPELRRAASSGAEGLHEGS